MENKNHDGLPQAIGKKMDQLSWIKGQLYAFKKINERVNNSHHFEILTFSPTEKLPSLIDRVYNTKGTYLQDETALIKPADELAVSLHGWLFVFLGYENDNSDGDPNRFIDSKNHFSISRYQEYRMGICNEIANAICEVTKVQVGKSIVVRSDESCLSFGRHFLFEGREANWWIWFGGLF